MTMDVREKLVELLDNAIIDSDDNYGFPNTNQVADHLISNGVTVQEWISVKDGLPENSGFYLVLHQDKYDRSASIAIDYYVICGAGEWWANEFTHNITHWMPLPEQPEATEQTEPPVYYEMYFTEDDVAEVAKMLWGEARGCTRDNQIKCAWVVVNRVDDERFPDTIHGVLSQPNQFHGYDPTFPVTDELYSVAFDVLTRWSYEKQGIPVRRELPNTYLWFTGDGEQNYFREEW